MRSYKYRHLDVLAHFNPNNLFQVILKEIDETFSDEELDGICSDVSCFPHPTSQWRFMSFVSNKKYY